MSSQQLNQRVHNIRASLFVMVLLLLSDTAVIMGSFYLATQIRTALNPYLGPAEFWRIYQPMVYLCMGFVVLLFYFNDLYPGFGQTAVKEFEKTSTILSLVFLFLGGTTYFLNIYDLYPRSIFLLAWIIGIIFVPLLRFIIRNRILKYSWYGIPILFVTDGIGSYSTLTALQNCRRMGWNPLAIYSLGNDIQGLDNFSIPIITSWKSFLDLKNKHGVNIAIFSAEPNQENSRWIHIISEKFKIVTLIIPHYNLGSLWIKPRDLEGRLGLEIRYNLLIPGKIITKRIFDIIGSTFLLILPLPIWLIIFILIRLDSKGPIFYQHSRVGKNGNPFDMLKFRTMVVDADQKLTSYLDSHPQAKQEWEEYQKLKEDPRITKFGYWLRKFSLDEIPQFWNVLKGEMSLIGPRAVTKQELEKYGDYKTLILRVKPGITGWWQVMGRNETTWETRKHLEVYYVSNWSLWMDAYITLKTIWVMIRGQGR